MIVLGENFQFGQAKAKAMVKHEQAIIDYLKPSNPMVPAPDPTPDKPPAGKFRALADGLNLQRSQALLHALADAWDNGTIPHSLKAISNRKQIELLISYDRARRYSEYHEWARPEHDCQQTGRSFSYHHADFKAIGILLQSQADRAVDDLLALIDPKVGKQDPTAKRVKELTQQALIGADFLEQQANYDRIIMPPLLRIIRILITRCTPMNA